MSTRNLPEMEPDIRRARTLSAEAMHDPAWYERAKERIFAASWQLIADSDRVVEPGTAVPLTMLEGSLEEPIYLARDRAGALHCRSNVCTHRGNLVVNAPCKTDVLRCRYHGRRFTLEGAFVSMPEFEGVKGFPSPNDDLPAIPHAQWGKLVFASLHPAFSFDALLGPMRERLATLPLDRIAFDAATSRDYEVEASWILYCDNYLEGFHIPFVHAGLNRLVEYGDYRTELLEYGTLQVAIGAPGTEVFELPKSAADHGQRVAAYYLWLFPNTMLNFYPWGVSVNVVKPLGPHRTRVSFLSYPWDPSRQERGAGSDLNQVELEDEEVVESVQRGTRSRLYRGGRYSPTRETGVHHFHRLMTRFLRDPVTAPVTESGNGG
ncbi:MAG TPA: aromatic ring-hydroxylating dioxygenase subunit alpha [Myxococcaceae bacterium]|nr:aromatic ring-hydroxylating dioxygenase subunit alpha [Myxococcaceae bacterium]